jgi:hypothetical protein
LLVPALVAAVAATVAFALAACGSEENAQQVEYTHSSQGKAESFSGPTSTEAGEAEVTFANETDRWRRRTSPRWSRGYRSS